MLSLSVERREGGSTKARILRRAGSLPAVVYGARHESTPIALSTKEFEKIFKEAGEATVVALTGLGEDVPALIHEVDLDPLTSQPRHVDFYAITKGQKVEVKIPIEFVGEAPAVKAGANVVKVLHEIEIKADPMNLPHHFTAELGALAAVGDQIRVADLLIPEGVELKTSADEVIALVQEIVEEKVEEAPAPVDLSAIEVEKKGKEEEAATGGEDPSTPAPAKKESK